jgi:biopolymer transport protein ExbD
VLGKPVSEGGLIEYVDQELAAVGNDPNRVKILVRASRTGDSRTVNNVVETLQGMGLTQIRIGVITTSYD